jgi:hypothetical protein
MSPARNAARPVEPDDYIPPGSDSARFREPLSDEPIHPEETGAAPDAAENFEPDDDRFFEDEEWLRKAEKEAEEAGEAPEKRRSWLGRAVGKLFRRGSEEAAQEAAGIDAVAQGNVGEEKAVPLTDTESSEAARLRARVYDAEHQLQTFDLRTVGDNRKQRETLYWMYEEWTWRQTDPGWTKLQHEKDPSRSKKPHNEFTDEVNKIYERLGKKKWFGKNKGAYYSAGKYSTLTDDENALLKEAEGRNLTDYDVRAMINGERPWQVAAYERAMEMLRAEDEAATQAAAQAAAPAQAGKTGGRRLGRAAFGAAAGAAALGTAATLLAARGNMLAGADPTKGQEVPATTIEVEHGQILIDLLAKIETADADLKDIEAEVNAAELDQNKLRGLDKPGDPTEQRIQTLLDNLDFIAQNAADVQEPVRPGGARHDAKTYSAVIKRKLGELDAIHEEQERLLAKLKLLREAYAEALKGVIKNQTEISGRLAAAKAERQRLDIDLDKEAYGWARMISPADAKKIDELENQSVTRQKRIDTLEKSLKGLSAKRQRDVNRQIIDLLEQQQDVSKQIRALKEKILKPVKRFIAEKRLKTGFGKVDEIAEGYRDRSAAEQARRESRARVEALVSAEIARASESDLQAIKDTRDEDEIRKILSGLGAEDADLKNLGNGDVSDIYNAAALAAEARRKALSPREPSAKELEAMEDAETAARAERAKLPKKGGPRTDDADLKMRDRAEHERVELAEATMNKAHGRIESDAFDERLDRRTRAKIQEDLERLRKISNIGKIGEILGLYLELEDAEVGSLDKEDANILKDELIAKLERYLAAPLSAPRAVEPKKFEIRPEAMAILKEISDKLSAEHKQDLADAGKLTEGALRDELADVRNVTDIDALKEQYIKRGYAVKEQLDKLTTEEIKVIREQIEHDIEHLIWTVKERAKSPVAAAAPDAGSGETEKERNAQLIARAEAEMAGHQAQGLEKVGVAKAEELESIMATAEERAKMLAEATDREKKIQALAINKIIGKRDASGLDDAQIDALIDKRAKDVAEIKARVEARRVELGAAGTAAKTDTKGEVRDEAKHQQAIETVGQQRSRIADSLIRDRGYTLAQAEAGLRKAQEIAAGDDAAIEKALIAADFIYRRDRGLLSKDELKTAAAGVVEDYERVVAAKRLASAEKYNQPQPKERRGKAGEAWKKMTDALKAREAALASDTKEIGTMEELLEGISSLQLSDSHDLKTEAGKKEAAELAERLRRGFVDNGIFERKDVNVVSDMDVIALRNELETSTRRALEAAKKIAGGEPPAAASARDTAPGSPELPKSAEKGKGGINDASSFLKRRAALIEESIDQPGFDLPSYIRTHDALNQALLPESIREYLVGAGIDRGEKEISAHLSDAELESLRSAEVAYLENIIDLAQPKKKKEKMGSLGEIAAAHEKNDKDKKKDKKKKKNAPAKFSADEPTPKTTDAESPEEEKS